MTLYCLLLLFTPFHSDPRMSHTLFQTSIMIVTPVKVLGMAALAAAFLSRPNHESAPRLQSSLPLLFVPFAVFPPFATLISGLPMPTANVSQLISAALLFGATRPLLRTKERMVEAVRTLVVGFAIGSLWVYKQHFLQHAGQAWGLEGDPNYEALMLLLPTPLAFWMALNESNSLWRRIGLGCGLTLAGAIVLTESRAGIMAGALVGFVGVMRSRHKLLGIALIALLAVAIFSWGPAGLSDRFQSIKFTGEAHNGDENSTRIHVELLKAGMRMIESHPLFGIGLDQFKALAPEYNPEVLKLADRSYIAHDTFLQIGAECGMPALLLFIVMLGIAARNFRSAQRNIDSGFSACGQALQLSIVGVSVVAFTITAELLPFWLLIFFSQNFREIAVALPGSDKRMDGHNVAKDRTKKVDSSYLAPTTSSFAAFTAEMKSP